jgi:hypothetical protein
VALERVCDVGWAVVPKLRLVTFGFLASRGLKAAGGSRPIGYKHLRKSDRNLLAFARLAVATRVCLPRTAFGLSSPARPWEMAFLAWTSCDIH